MLSVTVCNAVVPAVSTSPSVLPIGPLMIASVLRRAGFEVAFRDYQTCCTAANRADPDAFYRFVSGLGTEIVALGAMSGIMPTMLPALRRLKSEQPDRILILGGPGPTDTPVDIMNICPVDVIVAGEGEATIVELIRALQDGRPLDTVAGIWFRRDGRPVGTGRRPRLRDLDRLPPPAYDLIDFADYSGGLHIMTSRGCPYRCKFCSTHSIWGHRVTERSIAAVVDEIASVSDRITWMTLCDDNLALKPDRLRLLCRLLRERDLGLPWMSYGRINLIDEGLIEAMAAAGCEEVFYGIESGSQRVLDALDKRIDLKQARAVVKMTASRILRVNTTYIWGYPFENPGDLVDTLMAVAEDERIDRVVPHLYLLGPLVNTPLYREYHRLLRFAPDFVPHVASVPVGTDLEQFPELVDFIRRHPRVSTPFHHYDHPTLAEKRGLIERVRQRSRATDRPVGPAASRLRT